MKLFQKLLVAPAALGLLAPLAANAAEVNINDVAGYATPTAGVTTAQFSDVVPGDWAYTALQNLSESYGCVDNAYTQNLKSGQALTRYEAAALVNACLEGGIASADVNGDATRLSNEFGTEMAILKGRVDGLEYKVQELSAGQFSSSTKMSGGAVFTTGFADLDGATVDDNKLTSQYAFTLDLNTSFTGSDNLYAGLEQGNSATVANDDGLRLDSASDNANLSVTSLFYSWPVGDFQLTAGPLVDADDVISATTSLYSGSFRLAAMPWGVDGDVTGVGAAGSWANDNGFNASFATISEEGNDSAQGIYTAEGSDHYVASLGYDSDDNWGIGLIYTNDDNESAATGSDTSFGAGVYYTPDGFPTISVAYDSIDYGDSTNDSENNWLVGLDHEWGPGTASLAIQRTDDGATKGTNYEVYYDYPVNDGVSVKAGFYSESAVGTQAEDTNAYIVETTFSF